MKTKRLMGLVSLMLMLSVSASAQLEYWSVYVPQFEYRTEFIRVKPDSRGLTLSNLSNYLFFSVDHDKGLLTISLLKTDSTTTVQKNDPIATMRWEDSTFTYVDPSRERNLYYIKDDLFNAMVLRGADIVRQVMIYVDKPSTDKFRKINVVSRDSLISRITW